MKKQYSTMVEKCDDLPDGGEIELFIKDLTPGPRKYDTKKVLAKIMSSPEKLPEGDILWLRTKIGKKLEKPWAIKILKHFEDNTIPGHPYSGMRKE